MAGYHTRTLSITVVYMCFSFLMVIPMYVCRIVLLGFIMLTPFVVYLTVVDLTIPAFSILPPPSSFPSLALFLFHVFIGFKGLKCHVSLFLTVCFSR